MIEMLKQWQPLVGATLGGVFALSTAFIVAGAARRREQRTAAYLLTVDLVEVAAAAERLRERELTDRVSDNQRPGWLAEKLIWRRPQLSPSFDENVARVTAIDTRLSSHLHLFRINYAGIQEHLQRLKEDGDDRRRAPADADERQFISRDERRAHARIINTGFDTAVAHAKFASHFLEEFVLGTRPRWLTKLMMRAHPRYMERASSELLAGARLPVDE